MNNILNEEMIQIINNKESIKVISTIDEEGIPHVVFKQSLRVNEEGYLEYWDYVETSITNKNMVYSIWFQKKIAINILYKNVSYQIKGIPYRALIHGQEYEKRYRIAKQEKGIELSTVWLINPVEVREETLLHRVNVEKEKHPILGHLDYLTKKGE